MRDGSCTTRQDLVDSEKFVSFLKADAAELVQLKAASNSGVSTGSIMSWLTKTAETVQHTFAGKSDRKRTAEDEAFGMFLIDSRWRRGGEETRDENVKEKN